MKRFYALLLSVIMIVTLSLSALASPGPAAQAKPAPAPAAEPAPVVVEIGVADLKATVATTEMKNYLANDLMENEDFLAVYDIPSDAKIAAAFDFTFDGEIPAGGVIIPIPVPTAEVGDYVIVMHRKADGIWEVVGRGFLGADKTISATFTSFSPVMVLVADAPEGGRRAPRTGE
jgi:hypothetical protein